VQPADHRRGVQAIVSSSTQQPTACQPLLSIRRRKGPMPSADFFRRYLQALADIHASFDLEATQSAVVRSAVTLYNARGANLMLFNPNEENLLISASFGLSDAFQSKGTISPRKSLGETVDRVPVIVRDVTTDPRIQYPEATLKEGIRCVVGLPLTATSAMAGALRLYFSQPREFVPEEMESLQALAHQAGLALKKSFYFASMKAAVSDIQGMPSTDIKEAMQSLLATVAKYGLARGSGLLLLDPKANTLSTVIRYGLSESYLAKGPLLAGLSLGEVTTGKPVVVSKVATDSRIQYKEAAAAEHILAILGLPIRIGDEIAGALRLYYPFEFEPGPDYLTWMEHLAHHVGIALEKTRLMIKLKDRANWYEAVLRDLER
jgi:GAF domain-containing protein